jgi:hypothetical protein
MNANKIARALVIASVLLLSACSTTQLAYKQNITLYFESHEELRLSDEAIKDSPVDLIYVRNGERPTATMALAFIENGQYKWLSSDGAMIVTAHGRLVRTAGFAENLIYVSQVKQDPLTLGGNITQANNRWLRRIDTEMGDRGALLSSQLRVISDASLIVQDYSFAVVKVEEDVTYDSAQHGTSSWTNTFWFDSKTNQLVKSSQAIAPSMDNLEITYISRVLRLANANESGAQ